MKKLAILRGMHAKQWEEFLQLNMQRQQRAMQRQQRARQHASGSSYDSYNQPNYPDYDRSSGNPNYMGANLPMESSGRYPYPVEDYSSSRPPHDSYGEFQSQRHEDYGKTYNRY